MASTQPTPIVGGQTTTTTIQTALPSTTITTTPENRNFVNFFVSGRTWMLSITSSVLLLIILLITYFTSGSFVPKLR